MVGAPQMFVKDRAGPFSLLHFFLPYSWAGPTRLPLHASSEGVLDHTFREHKRRLGLPSPLFLTANRLQC
jgi:hypothetical protein